MLHKTPSIGETVAGKIKAARLAADMTQTDLAKAVGTTQSMIAKYESGEQEPTVSRLIEIAKSLGVDPGELLK